MPDPTTALDLDYEVTKFEETSPGVWEDVTYKCSEPYYHMYNVLEGLCNGYPIRDFASAQAAGMSDWLFQKWESYHTRLGILEKSGEHIQLKPTS